MPEADFPLKVIKPNIGGGRVSGSGEKHTSSFDLVEETHFLFLRVVKARDLAYNNAGGIRYPFVEKKIGNYKGTTKYFEMNKPNPEWNQVLAFTKDRIQSLSAEIAVREKESVDDEFIGKIVINMSDIPTRVPPDSPQAPQWYKLEDKEEANANSVGELMLVIWFRTQADEVFPDSWHSDVAAVNGDSIMNTRSKVYLSPRLWYLRVNIIEAQDLVLPSDKNRITEVYVRATLGNVKLRTKVSADKSLNPSWNEDLMFVAAEPFYDPLILTVLDKNRDGEISLGSCMIHLSKVYIRWLPEPVGAEWYDLEKVGVEAEELNFASKLNMRISLNGGYHVFDESVGSSSDYRATFTCNLCTTFVTQYALHSPVVGISAR